MILQRGLSKANNYGLHLHLSQEVRDGFRAKGIKINDAIEPIIKQVHATNHDDNLSPQGKVNKIEEYLSRAATSLDAINETDNLRESGERMRTDSLNRTVQAMDKHLPEDKMQFAMDRQLILNMLPVQEGMARTAHQEILDTAEREGIPLTDEQREFESPTIQKLNAAVESGVTKDNAVFIDTCFRAPYPVQLVPEDVLAEAQQVLEQTTSSDLHEGIEANRHLQRAYKILMDFALDVLADPLSVAFQEDNVVMDSIKSKVGQ